MPKSQILSVYQTMLSYLADLFILPLITKAINKIGSLSWVKKPSDYKILNYLEGKVTEYVTDKKLKRKTVKKSLTSQMQSGEESFWANCSKSNKLRTLIQTTWMSANGLINLTNSRRHKTRRKWHFKLRVTIDFTCFKKNPKLNHQYFTKTTLKD